MTLLLSLTLALAPSQAGWPDKVRAASAELAGAGLALPEAGVPVETLESPAFEALFEAELARAVGPKRVELQRALRGALTLAGPPPSPATGASVRYDVERNVLAVRAGSVPPEDGTELAHELVRAALDHETDLAAWLAREPHTSDSGRVRAGWLEGAAAFGAAFVREKQRGREFASVSLDVLNSASAGGSTEFALSTARSSARAEWFARFRSRAVEALSDELDNLPASTEQLLHVRKRDQDEPRAVSLPAWPDALGVAEILRDDVFGELDMLALLVEAGVDATEARRAALGWDGDRLQLLRAKTGELALVWRIVFDRPEDARQFAAVWTTKTIGAMATRGATFDWVRSDSLRLGTALGEALKAHTVVRDFDDADRVSTAELEAGLQKNTSAEPRFVGERWFHPRYGVSIALPANWSAGTLNGQQQLLGELDPPYRDRIAVSALENLAGKSLAELLEQQKASLSSTEGATVVIGELRKVGGRDVIYLRYDLRIETKTLHMATTAFENGGKLVMVTASISDRTWPAIGAEIERVLNDLSFETPKPAAQGSR